MDLKDIKAIIDLMKKNSISEFELEHQDFKIKLNRGVGTVPVAVDEAPSTAYTLPASVAPGSPASVPPPPPAPTGPALLEVKSPMIGTFYRAPSPESAPYIEIGTEVGPETVVCLDRKSTRLNSSH